MKLSVVVWIVAAILVVAVLLWFASSKGILNTWNLAVSGRDDSGGHGEVGGHLIAGDRIKVAIRGWKREETERILDDFAKSYDLNRADLRLSSTTDGTQLVEFPNGLTDDKILFLVNYLHYPRGYDLTKRDLTIVGIWRLDGESYSTGLDAEPRAVVYMPDNDSEYDQAFLQTNRTQTFRVPFTNMTWIPVEDPRMSAMVAELEKSIQ